MKWRPSNPNKVIGRKERRREGLPSITPLLATLVGNHDMLPLIARGGRRSKKW